MNFINIKSTIGNAYKTILARTSRSKSADLDVSDEDRSNTSKALSSIGISVYDENGEYQDFSKTLDQLSEKWNTLSKSQQSYVAEQMAGIRNLNTMSAIIETWKDAKSIASDAVSDTGFIDETQEKYMDSVNAHINRLQTSIQELWNELLDTGAISTLTDALNLLINVAEKLIGVFSTIGDVLPVVNGGFVSLAGTVGTIAAGWSVFSNVKQAYKDIGEAEKGSDLAGKNGIVEGLKKTKEDTTELLSSITGEFTKFKDGYKTTSQGLSGFSGITEGLKGGWNALSGLSKGMIGLTAGIAAVSLAVSTFDKLVKSSKETAEAVNKARKEYDGEQKTLQSHKETIDSISNKYSTLSKGVDGLGNNVSLTTTEFEEYHNVCNQIAEMYPSLVQSYDAQGNAILKLKGNIEGLKDAYENEVLSSAQKNIENYDTYTENLRNATGNKDYWTNVKDRSSNLFGTAKRGGRVDNDQALENLSKINEMNLKEWKEFYNSDQNVDLMSYLESDVIGLSGDMSEDEFAKAKDKISTEISAITAEINNASVPLKSALNSYFTTLTTGDNADFSKLQDNTKTEISSMISNMSASKAQEMTKNGGEAGKSYVVGLTKALNNSKNAQAALNSLFSINENTSIEDSKKIIDNNFDALKEELKKNGIESDDKELLLQFGLKDKQDAIDAYDSLIKASKKVTKETKAEGKETKKIKKYIKDNNITTKEQLNVLKQCVSESENMDDAIRNFSLKNISVDGIDNQLNNLRTKLETVKSDIEKINDAITASNESTGMTVEQIKNIESVFSGLSGYDRNKLFESTAEGVKLNKQELQKLNEEYAKTNKQQYTNKIADLENQYTNLCVAIGQTTDATERNELINKRNTLKEKISEAQELQSQYEGLTNAVTAFFKAQSGGEAGDNYDSIQGSLEKIKELYDKGLTGTNEFKAAVKMMTPDDIDTSGWTNTDWIDQYEKKIGMVNSYFTEGQEGCVNFLKRLEQLGYATDKGGGAWEIYNADIDEVSKSMGVSSSLATELFNKLTDYGAQISFTEETEYLKNLRLEAEKAKEALSGSGYQLDISTTNSGDIDKQLKKGKEYKKALEEQKEALEANKEGIKRYGAVSSDEYKNTCKQLEKVNEQLGYVNKEMDYLQGKKGESADFTVDVHTNDGIERLNEDIKKLNKNDKINISIAWGNNDAKYWDDQLKNISKAITNLPGGKINIDTEEGKSAQNILIGIIQKQQEISRPTILNVDASKLSNGNSEIDASIKKFQELYKAIENYNQLEVRKKNGDVSVSDEQLKKAKKTAQDLAKELNGMSGTGHQLAVGVGLKFNKDGELKGNLSKITNQFNNKKIATAYVGIGVKDDAVKEYKKNSGGKGDKNNKKSKNDIKASVIYKVVSTKVDEFMKRNHDINAKINYTYTVTGTPMSNLGSSSFSLPTSNKKPKPKKKSKKTKGKGSHGLNGTAFANGTGDWGAKRTQTALVGEVAPELHVNSRTGKWELLGENGAEFAKINKGDIIFNGQQTEELLKSGRALSNGGRGKALINGTVEKVNSLFGISGNAYGRGNYGGSLRLNYSKSGSKKKKSSNKASSSSSKSNNSNNSNNSDKNDFKEIIDWIEILIDRVERSISHLETTATSTFKNWATRNNALAQEYNEVVREIGIQQQAYNRYTAQANSVGLDSGTAQAVRDGKIDISTITDENYKNKVDDYKEWYEKSIECQDKIIELQEKLGDLTKQKFDNVSEEFEGQLELIEHRINMVKTGLDIVEEKGNFASKNYYDTLMSIEQETNNKLQQELSSLNSAFNEAMSKGTIQANSSSWVEMRKKINEVTEAILESDKALLEYKNDMRENDWKIFDWLQDRISDTTAEADFMVDLLSNNESELFSKKSGHLTDKGKTVGALHATNYNVYMNQADQYAAKVKEINQELASDPSNTKLIEQKHEYIKAQQDAIKSAQEEKSAVKELVSDSYDKMLEILQKLIDKRKEFLDAEKD